MSRLSKENLTCRLPYMTGKVSCNIILLIVITLYFCATEHTHSHSLCEFQTVKVVAAAPII